MRRTLAFLFLALAACPGNPTPPGPIAVADLAAPPGDFAATVVDLAVRPADLAPSADLTGFCNGMSCKDPTPACDPMTGLCVPCLPKNDTCPKNSYCLATNGSYDCFPGCKLNGDCPGMVCCGHVCIDVKTDANNCGMCNTACGISSTCCGGTCVDPAKNPAHCGACGKACPNGVLVHANIACVMSMCTVASCIGNYFDCNTDPSDGCEAALQNDPSNCGMCGKFCDVANGEGACQGGCTVKSCYAGFADCNKQYADGCETATTKDGKNCGACGNVCAALPNATAGCAGGKCVPGTCTMGFGDCDMQALNGCETTLAADAKNCGACGNACNVANGLGACIGGACSIASCGGVFKDCNMSFADGCESDPAKDGLHCGGCGKKCAALPNASSGCQNSVCALGACTMGFGDCNLMPADGCEVTLATNAKNCGMCGKVCPNNMPACVAGVCIAQLTSCQDIMAAGLSVGDGLYSIDTDGPGGNAPFQVFCEMSTDGGGWQVMAYLRAPGQWSTPIFTDLNTVGDVAKGFTSGLLLKNNTGKFKEKIIIYLNLVEAKVSVGKQWMVNARVDGVAIPFTMINTPNGWNYRDSFKFAEVNAGNVCSHDCATYRGFGMFHDGTGVLRYCGTQTGDNGCRDGNNICWMPRIINGGNNGCNVADFRCSYLTGPGEGVIYGAR
ncbi:MAG: hypothetical protein EXR72_09800 [Myxococcales bacterium]|nr:hypothetical protein [Myxococcales bacterium]